MLVNPPKLESFILMRARNFYCLYTYKNGWDAENKRSYRLPGSTKCVGKLISGSKVGIIEWKQEFIDAHPGLEQFVAKREENGKIIFDPIDEMISISEAVNLKRQAAGATWVFDHLLAETPLAKALSQTFGAYKDHKKILSLAYFLNIEESNAMVRYEVFSEKYRLPWTRPMGASVISRLLSRITPNKIDKFVSMLNTLTMERNEKNTVKNRYLALDSTSISTHSLKLAKSAYGHNKDGDDLPQINVLLVVDQNTGEPVYYRAYNGNVPDVSTVKHFLQEQARIKLDENAVFVADKGYSSVYNIHRFLQSKASFLFNMLPRYSVCKNLFSDLKLSLLDPLNYDTALKCSHVTKEIQWSFPANFKTNAKDNSRVKLKAPLYVHFYFDKDINHNAYKTLTENIAKIGELYRAGKPIPEALMKIKNRFITENTKNKTITTNLAEVENYLAMKGVRILVSDTVKDAVEAFQAYYDRNEVEYAFNLFKQRLNGNRMRVSNNCTLEGKAFVQFIATSIAIMFRKKLNDVLRKDKSIGLSYDSDSVVIDKLNTIEQTVFEHGVYYSETVGGLKKLLTAMNIPIPIKEVERDYEADLKAEAEEKMDYMVDEFELPTLAEQLE